VSVLILGGGINGVGLFRELALQGVDCALVERSDFAAGATSASSRMIHGGLRYLETGQIRLVREALAERNRLLETAPHYVAPLKTTMPLFSWTKGLLKAPLLFLGLPLRPGGRGVLLVKLGLWFYDFVTRGNRRTPVHYIGGKEDTLWNIPGLNPRIIASATYWDACISQAERLCVELIKDACAADERCRALNHVSLERVEGGAAVFTDRLTGAPLTLRPRIVVNATGAWIDKTNATLGMATSLVGGTKGSHLVLEHRELALSLGDRMVYYEHTDGRICIAYAFMGKVIVGSTDLPVDDPDTARCEEAEIEYMLATVRRMFPGLAIGREQVIFTMCGVRPLPASEASTPGSISRDHRIEIAEPAGERPFPIYSLVGGKWTTFRALAEGAADLILARLAVPRRLSTAAVAIGGGKGFPRAHDDATDWVKRVAAQARLGRERVLGLLRRYGSAAESYALKLDGRGETTLKTLPSYSVEETEWVVEQEFVERLTDLLARRSVIALLGQATPDVAAEIAPIVGRLRGWDPDRQAEEIRLALEAFEVRSEGCPVV
jgi:glycerol-3-phosphate dehydrogenase